MDLTQSRQIIARVRLRKSEKELLELATAALGMTLSDFLRGAALRKAKAVLLKHDKGGLSRGPEDPGKS